MSQGYTWTKYSNLFWQKIQNSYLDTFMSIIYMRVFKISYETICSILFRFANFIIYSLHTRNFYEMCEWHRHREYIKEDSEEVTAGWPSNKCSSISRAHQFAWNIFFIFYHCRTDNTSQRDDSRLIASALVLITKKKKKYTLIYDFIRPYKGVQILKYIKKIICKTKSVKIFTEPRYNKKIWTRCVRGE